MDDVEELLNETERTMKIHLGFGSLSDKQFRGVDYAHNFVNFWDDTNFPHFSEAHP